MATMEVALRVSIRPQNLSMEELEDAVGEAVEQAGRDLFRRASQVLEDGLLERERCGCGKAQPKTPAVEIPDEESWARASWKTRIGRGPPQHLNLGSGGYEPYELPNHVYTINLGNFASV